MGIYAGDFEHFGGGGGVKLHVSNENKAMHYKITRFL